MKTFAVKFKDAPVLECQLDNTHLAERYYELLKQQYTDDPNAIFRDQQKYTIQHFEYLVNQAQQTLGWDWRRDSYDLATTTQLHKDIEQYLARGFENIPEQHDEILHELHYALHAIESGSRRNSWLQIEWYNNRGFPIVASEYPAKRYLEFGNLRLQNPHVGHHPLYLYQQQDSLNVMQTCKFHDFCKPGVNIVINENNNANNNANMFNEAEYINWFSACASEFVAAHGMKKILQFTGHPIVGCVRNLDDLRTVVSKPILEFDSLIF